jgi:hypothetical protein
MARDNFYVTAHPNLAPWNVGVDHDLGQPYMHPWSHMLSLNSTTSMEAGQIEGSSVVTLHPRLFFLRHVT